ncbi:hypothetical protein [Bacteroides sp. UBA939]|uniref:hypothetical protein n=1 Tax=Bacteroides sp. UBA939 TaxID=1946092 RepID=UPI0025BF2B55|nr:hypothetical protein [Bacteroides sp. UBA939]
MRTLLKWNFLIVLFMMCSVPLLMGCGGDDDEPTDGEVTYTGWEDKGNSAKFGYRMSAGPYSADIVFNLTFNGSGDDAVCTKCVIEETWSHEDAARESETSHRRGDEGETNVNRSGKKVTYETDGFNGGTRGAIKGILEGMYQH